MQSKTHGESRLALDVWADALRMAQDWGHPTGDDVEKYLARQFVENFMISNFVEEVYGEDKDIYKAILEILRNNDVDERALREEARAKIANVREGTVEYGKCHVESHERSQEASRIDFLRRWVGFALCWFGCDTTPVDRFSGPLPTTVESQSTRRYRRTHNRGGRGCGGLEGSTGTNRFCVGVSPTYTKDFF